MPIRTFTHTCARAPFLTQILYFIFPTTDAFGIVIFVRDRFFAATPFLVDFLLV